MSETPVSVGVIKQQSIQVAKPSHPAELLNQVPGVAISVTNGEGHQTAIRQGFSTAPLYLFLEDGIPVRATGNFNHNALYEVNIPGAGGVEVIRGPGTALYGSDAIGGVVNVLTKTPTAKSGQDLSLEFGRFGYGRLLGGLDTGRHAWGAVRADVNITSTDGWRNDTGYDRRSANARWDAALTDTLLVKTIVGYTKVDQETGANSALPYDLYVNSPKINLRSPAFRKVDAFRMSSAFDNYIGDKALLSVTPYVRNNKMDLNGTFNFTGDARIETTDVWSFGLLTKYRRDFSDAWRSRVILGLDLDHSPSSREENKITLSSAQIGPNNLYTQYTGYTVGERMYDYESLYQNVAPYVHYEASPWTAVRITAGLRFDYARYELDNRRDAGFFAAGGRQYYQPGSDSVEFSRLSPKIGMTYAFNDKHHVYATYNHGFRTPSESQLFRGGRSGTGTLGAQQAEALALYQSSRNLKAIKADQYEVGLRGGKADWNYEVVAYFLTKKDDLLSQRDATGFSVQTNNGETEHQGIEVGVGQQIVKQVRVDLAASYAKHTYKSWVTSTENFSGKEVESAPRVLANARLTWKPVAPLMAQLEWVRVGSYYLDPANRYGKYPGHSLFNLRSSYKFYRDMSVFFRVTNLADRRYADSASQNSALGGLYSPGMPRTFYAGAEARF